MECLIGQIYNEFSSLKNKSDSLTNRLQKICYPSRCSILFSDFCTSVFPFFLFLEFGTLKTHRDIGHIAYIFRIVIQNIEKGIPICLMFLCVFLYRTLFEHLECGTGKLIFIASLRSVPRLDVGIFNLLDFQGRYSAQNDLKYHFNKSVR